MDEVVLFKNISDTIDWVNEFSKKEEKQIKSFLNLRWKYLDSVLPIIT